MEAVRRLPSLRLPKAGRAASLIAVGVAASLAGAASSTWFLLWWRRLPQWRRWRYTQMVTTCLGGGGQKTAGQAYAGTFGTDIGGTLAKLVYLQPAKEQNPQMGLIAEMTDLRFSCRYLGGVLRFLKLPTDDVEAVVGAIANANVVDDGMRQMYATGGGAFKFRDEVERRLGINFVKVDEMDSLVIGLGYLIRHAPPGEMFTVEEDLELPFKRTPISMQRPFLLVNIGSGVSILRVSGSTMERCGGTAQGGATFLGLARLITQASTFEEAMALCEQGDSSTVDRLIRDIYGGDYERFGLKGDVVAASFGKLASMQRPRQSKQEDLALALLIMVTQQITLLAFYIAKERKCTEIVFVGGFLRYNRIAARRIAEAIDFLGRGSTRAVFLRHADFVGAIGALVQSQEDPDGSGARPGPGRDVADAESREREDRRMRRQRSNSLDYLNGLPPPPGAESNGSSPVEAKRSMSTPSGEYLREEDADRAWIGLFDQQGATSSD